MDKATEREFERMYLKGKREGIQLRGGQREMLLVVGMAAGVALSLIVVMVTLLLL
jgi:hypothetical protein